MFPLNREKYLSEAKKVEIKEPIDAIKHGLAFVTEDRKLTGIFPDLSIKDNMIMPDIDNYP